METQLTLGSWAERIPGVFDNVAPGWLHQEARVSEPSLSLRSWRVRLSVGSLGLLSLHLHLCVRRQPLKANFRGAKCTELGKILDVLGVTASWGTQICWVLCAEGKNEVGGGERRGET